MKDDKKKRNAIARVLEAPKKSEAILTEAKRAKVAPRTIERWVKENETAGGAAAPVGRDVVSGNVGSPEKPRETAEDPALKAALGAAGGDGTKPGPTPIGPQDFKDAKAEAKKFCVDTIGSLTQMAGSAIVTTRYSPPLLLSDQAVQKLLELSMLEVGLIEANVDTLHPFLVKWLAGPYQLVGGLVFGQVLRWIGLDNLAKNRGWKDAAKPASPAAGAAAPPPPPHRPAAPPPTAPAFVPPTDGITSEDRSKGPYGNISDAPRGTSPYILPPLIEEPAAA